MHFQSNSHFVQHHVPEPVEAETEEAVARCLAKQSGGFVGAADWHAEPGDQYRDQARQVLQTIANVQAGIRSGGLPSQRPAYGNRLRPALAAQQREIPNRKLEDWAIRLADCSHEAQDEQLGPLESDLLDIRDEILHELHANL